MPCRLVWRPTGRNRVSSSPTGQHLLNYVHSYISGSQGVNITLFLVLLLLLLLFMLFPCQWCFFFRGGGVCFVFVVVLLFLFFVVPYALPLLRLMLVLFMSESIFY